MNFDMEFLIPPARMTFEQALDLQRFADAYDLQMTFEGFTGAISFTEVPSPKEFTVIDRMAEMAAVPMGVTAEGVMDFKRYFGKEAAMTAKAMRTYCQLCEEGKVW